MIRIIANDALAAIPELVAEGLQVDSVVTDPPYHLQARTSRFGAADAAPPQFGRDGAMGRLSKGFMGKTWDGGDVAFRPKTWATIATVMRPGAFLLSFGGTRTFHRVACAIEDGGLIIQDCIMWLYGTGFPKRRDMLKPAWEPIIVAYKPGGDRTMQIDECRIGTDENLNGGAYAKNGSDRSDDWGAHNGYRRNQGLPFEQPTGRWPANLCHDGSDEVVSMFPNSKSGNLNGETVKADNRIYNTAGSTLNRKLMVRSGSEGSAARFFWSPKAGKKDRNGSKHPTIKPIRLLDWLVPLVTPVGGTVLDPFAGSGTTGSAALNTGRNAILIEREPEYIADIRRRFYGTSEEALRDLTATIREMIDGLR
jgi:site-specific DNA-methyltransferase (adenine-specific)